MFTNHISYSLDKLLLTGAFLMQKHIKRLPQKYIRPSVTRHTMCSYEQYGAFDKGP